VERVAFVWVNLVACRNRSGEELLGEVNGRAWDVVALASQ
jgi:hypothetical protein